VYSVWWGAECRLTLVQADDPQRLFSILEERGDPSDVAFTQCHADFVMDLSLADPFLQLRNPAAATPASAPGGQSLPPSSQPKALAISQLQRDLLGLLKGTRSQKEARGFCEEFSDVELVCGEQRFRVHRVILAARSEFFRTMFAAGLAESSSREVRIRDVHPDALACILRYIYNGDLDLKFPEPEVAKFQSAGRKHVRAVGFTLQVLEAAASFLMTELRDHCEAIISGFNLSLSELIEALIVAERVGADGLKGSCLVQLAAQKRLPLVLAELQEEAPLPPEVLQLICQAAKLPDLSSPTGKLLVELHRARISEAKVKE